MGRRKRVGKDEVWLGQQVLATNCNRDYVAAERVSVIEQEVT
jgi:hypothetical protein